MAPTRLDVRIACLLAVCSFLYTVLFVHGHFAGTDEVEMFEQTKSLFERGDFAVPPGVNTFPGKDGRPYAIFAVGQSTLAVPFYALGKIADRTLPRAWAERLAGLDSWSGTVQWGGTVPIFMVGLYSPTICALLVGLFYLSERRFGVSAASAVLASALLAATTYVSTMSLFFLQHMTEALLLLGGFYCFYSFKQGKGWTVLAAGSLVASLTLLVRIPGCMAAPALVAYVGSLLRRRAAEGTTRGTVGRALLCLGIPAAAVLAVHFAVNLWRFGTWIRSPYIDQIQAFTGPVYLGVYGFLLSPGGSIFVYSPLLLLLRWTLPPFWRSHRAECATVLGVALSFLLACSKNEDWTGLYSAPGPRFLFSVIPFLMLPLGLWLDGPKRRLPRITLWSLATVGLAVQLVTMLARWGNVIEIMQWKRFVPPLSFVWIPDWCPIVGCWMALAQGSVAPLLWKLLFGGPGVEAAPAGAALLLAVWAACFSSALILLLRGVRSVAD